MVSKRMYDDLEELLCHELNEITRKGSINRQDLDDLYKLSSTIVMAKSLTEDSDGQMMYDMYGRSGRNYNVRTPMWNINGSYDNMEMAMRNAGGSNAYGNNMYDYGNESYRRGRNQMNGRYMSRDSYEDNAYDSGYSRHSAEEKAIMKMEEIAETTQNPKVKQAIMQAVEKLEQ